jgi:hypothetical protein
MDTTPKPDTLRVDSHPTLEPERHRSPVEASAAPQTSRATHPALEAVTDETSTLPGATEPAANPADRKTARQKIANLLWWSIPANTNEEAKARTEQLLDEHRAEVLTEVTTWLVKKAREFHACSRKRERGQGDTCAVLASKIARGAVRPNNTLMPPNPGFFEVDRTYSSGTWEFRCVAVSPSPTSGEPRALGWKFAPVYDVHQWHAIALDPDDWKHGGWTETTAAGEVPA